jgi:hypothetical protein
VGKSGKIDHGDSDSSGDEDGGEESKMRRLDDMDLIDELETLYHDAVEEL